MYTLIYGKWTEKNTIYGMFPGKKNLLVFFSWYIILLYLDSYLFILGMKGVFDYGVY